MSKTKEDYVREYLESAPRLGVKLDPPQQAIIKTAEMAWVVDNYPLEPCDEPAGELREERA